MSQLIVDTVPVPLRIEDTGTVRVGETRVTLDTIIYAYKGGDSPEQIAEGFDTVPLADIYAVINYYLRHREEVEAYLKRRELEAAEIRAKWEAMHPQNGLHERLLARRRNVADPDSQEPPQC
jgi:uncharacterized protein (DUF433 family)